MAESEYVRKELRKTLNTYYQNWLDYDAALALDWGPLSSHYKDQLDRTITSKIDAWNDPSAVTKRTRAAARKQARIAMGLL